VLKSRLEFMSKCSSDCPGFIKSASFLLGEGQNTVVIYLQNQKLDVNSCPIWRGS